MRRTLAASRANANAAPANPVAIRDPSLQPGSPAQRLHSLWTPLGCAASVAVSEHTRRLVRERLSDEVGRVNKQAPHRVALAYPSPYRVGMSSLGYQRIYRAIQDLDGFCCERIFLPDEGDRPGARIERPVTYES